MRLLSAPIVSEKGEISGWVVNVNDVTEEAAARDALAFQSLHDNLTGLPNRVLFLDLVARELARRGPREALAVLLIDLDHFHRVNDGLGHNAGDELLLGVARRLSGVLRSDETLARFGGDVFTLLLEDISDVSAAVRVALRVTEALAAPFVVGPDSHETVVSASIGIVLADHKAGAEAVLRDADTAMNRAKTGGRGGYEIFEKEQYVQSLRRLTLEGGLPVVPSIAESCESSTSRCSVSGRGELVGAEALARWEHPTRGMLAPSELIELAEETGLIVPLGEQVTRRALTQLHKWDTAERPLRVPLLAVNFSAVQLSLDLRHRHPRSAGRHQSRPRTALRGDHRDRAHGQHRDDPSLGGRAETPRGSHRDRRLRHRLLLPRLPRGVPAEILKMDRRF